MEILKIRNVKSPERDASENAGIDFYVPEFCTEIVDALKVKNATSIESGEVRIDEDGIALMPHCAVLIPSGIKTKFTNNIALEFANKSGVCTRTQLVVGASVIDAGYQGEIHFHMINTSSKEVIIKFGSKIVQAIPRIIDTSDVVIATCTEDGFYTSSTNRGEGGFGSTGV